MKYTICLALAVLISTASAFTQDIKAPDYSAYILTPKAPDTPRINGPKVCGGRPGADFLYRIPATGVRPMTFAAEGLPNGLKLDGSTGIITGKVKKAGTYVVTLKAENELGSNERQLRIIIGDCVALTPPLGWNSWNCWGNSVSQELVENSAKAMVESGLADYGWSYVNIDDGWQGVRGGEYKAIQPNSKFPDMKALGEYIHSLGLKFGIYSTPWVSTYASHIGSSCDNPEGTYWWVEQGLVDQYYKLDRKKLDKEKIRYYGEYSFAANDVKQWVDWGVDYLKYDWNLNDVWWLKDMRDAIDASGRDIVYSISNKARVTIGPQLKLYADCWRTSTDIRDNWASISDIGFDTQDRWAGFKKPGRWPDADMLVLGKVGWGRKMRWTQLTPDEQYTHISLWAMLASPMLIGCDMSMLDDFTLSLLCNHEVLDINQDPLGVQGVKQTVKDDYYVYIKPLEDGSLAVGLFNISDKPQVIGFIPHKLGLFGEQTVRDVWRQKDIAKVSQKEQWMTEVAPHGVVLLRLSPGTTGEKLVGSFRDMNFQKTKKE